MVRAAMSLLVVILVFVALTGGLLFIDMPSRSQEFDCDDAAKFVYDRFERWGQQHRLTVMLGNLKMTGEEYGKSDHIWLLVRVGPLRVPVDWGQVKFGGRYYEGYEINYEKLVFFVQQDFTRESEPAN